MGAHLELLQTKWQKGRALQLALLLLIILFAAVLRFYKLGEWSFWFDEVSTVNRASVHFTSLQAILARPLPSTIWMPVSLILTGQTFNLMGVSEFTGRLVPALFGILSIPAIYFCARWLYGPGVGLLSAAILTLTPSHLFWSQNARFYTAMMLFVMLALFSFYYAFERDRPAFLIVGYIFLYLSVAERLTALLIYPAFLVYLLLLYFLPIAKPAGYRRGSLLLFLAPGIAFIALELFLLLTTGSSFLQDALQVFGENRGPSPFRLIYRIILDMGVVLSCLAIIGGVYLLAAKSRAGLFLVSFAATPVLLLMLLNPFVFTDERYVFMTLPAWIILAAIATKEIVTRIKLSDHGIWLIIAIPLLVLSVDLFVDMRYFQSNQGHRLDWHGAFAVIAARQQADDKVASYWPFLADYYLDEQTDSLTWLQPANIMKDNQRYWVVVDDYAIWSAPAISAWVEQKCELIMAEELVLERHHLLRVYLCDPSRIAPALTSDQ